MKFAKIITFLLWIILAISLFLSLSLVTNLTMKASNPVTNTWIDVNLAWAYILFIICCLAMLALESASIFLDKKATRNSFIAIGLLGAVILVSYLFSDSEIPQFHGVEKFIKDGTLTPTISLWIGTGLIVTYILGAISIIVIVLSSISNIFK